MGREQPGAPTPLLSCDTVVALGDITADGAVLLAKNSDRPPREAQRLIGVPAAEHGLAGTVRCQYVTVPQVARTAGLIGSQPYWLWGFEHGLNEHGVAIGNEALFTRETPQAAGLLGMDLVRLGLERGTTAREALTTITTLLEQFGQGGSAAHHAVRYYDNSFLIADPGEAWVLESSGRQWAARHLPHGAYAISNRPTIGSEYDLASADLVAYAEVRGWWPRGQRPFDFAEAYTDPHSGALASASCRLARSRQRLATRRATLTTSDMMALLRDHGPDPAGGPTLPWPNGREAATVCMHGLGEGGSATAASMVARLTHDAPPTYWASMAPPCTGVFLPCWPDCGTPPESAVADEAPTASSPWWRYRSLWEAVAAAPEPRILAERVCQAWLPLEAQLSDLIASPGPTAPLHVRRAVTAEAFAAATATLARLEQEVAPALTTG